MACSLLLFSGSGWSRADFRTNSGSLDFGFAVEVTLSLAFVSVVVLVTSELSGLSELCVRGSYRLILLSTLLPDPAVPPVPPRPAPPTENRRGS